MIIPAKQAPRSRSPALGPGAEAAGKRANLRREEEVLAADVRAAMTEKGQGFEVD